MDEKISIQAVDHYSKNYATRLLDPYYASREKITGPDILVLSPVRQVNLFVIHYVFQAWKTESNKLRSAYFNFDDPAVQEALESLMTTLSNNISINRSDLEPLLIRAVKNTIMLILDPYDFFADLIEEQSEIDKSTFKEQLKYLKINRAPLQRLLERLENNEHATVTSSEAFAMLDGILEEVNFTPEDVDPYLSQFSTTLPLTIDSIYEAVNSNANVQNKPKPVVQEVVHEYPSAVKETKPVSEAKETINEKLAQPAKATLADSFKKIGKIRDSLTINQKFMFTKVLFHGDFELFSQAVEDLDRQDNFQGAMKYLEQNYEEWDRESEEFHEFMELVEKRFA